MGNWARRAVPCCLSVIALMSLLLPQCTNAAPLFGVHDYGVGLYLSAFHDPQRLVDDWAHAGTLESYSPPVQLSDAPLRLYESGAKIDFVNPVDHMQHPVVAARAEVFSKDGDDRVELDVGAVAYTGLTVLGLADPFLPLSVTLSGSFLDFEPVPGDGLVDVEADLNIYDIQGRTLAQAVLGGSGNTSTFAWYCDSTGDLSPCTDAHKVWVLQQPRAEPWTSGRLDLPFNLPVESSAAGLIFDLWIKAKIDSRGELVPGGLGGKSNFIDTALLNINPAPGVTVTLADGQVFASAATVPEPCTLALLTIGVAGLLLRAPCSREESHGASSRLFADAPCNRERRG